MDSLRAVEKCTQHPGKMWVVRGHLMFPLLPAARAPRRRGRAEPWHTAVSDPAPGIHPERLLEIAWTRVILSGIIAGDLLVPFFTEGDEGFDVNDLTDWVEAERLLATARSMLPRSRAGLPA